MNFTPYQQSIYDSMKEHRFAQIAYSELQKGGPSNGVFKQGYILGYGKGWNTPLQKDDPIGYTKIRIISNSGLYDRSNRPAEEIYLVQIQHQLESPLSLEVAVEHTYSTLRELARSIKLSILLRESSEKKQLLICNLKASFRTPSFKIVITKMTKDKVYGLSMENDDKFQKEAEFAFNVNDILWDTLEFIDKEEGMTASNPKVRRFSISPVITDLENSEKRIEEIFCLVDEGIRSSLKHLFQISNHSDRILSHRLKDHSCGEKVKKLLDNPEVKAFELRLRTMSEDVKKIRAQIKGEIDQIKNDLAHQSLEKL